MRCGTGALQPLHRDKTVTDVRTGQSDDFAGTQPVVVGDENHQPITFRMGTSSVEKAGELFFAERLHDYLDLADFLTLSATVTVLDTLNCGCGVGVTCPIWRSNQATASNSAAVLEAVAWLERHIGQVRS